MEHIQKLKRSLIDIWGNNDFTDISLSVMSYHILRSAVDQCPALDELAFWADPPDKVEDIDPDNYRLTTHTLPPILLGLLLETDTLVKLLADIQAGLYLWNDADVVAWRGTLRLQLVLTYAPKLEQWEVRPMLAFMRKVTNDQRARKERRTDPRRGIDTVHPARDEAGQGRADHGDRQESGKVAAGAA
jgi:hypothetical protein